MHEQTFKHWHIAAVLSTGLLAASCTTNSKRADITADLAIPKEYTAGLGAVHSLDPNGWLSDLKAPGLEKLIREAVERNHDLKAAGAKMRAAKARAVLDGADRWPQVSGAIDPSASKRPGGSASGTNATTTGGATMGGRVSRESYELGLNLSWEIDLWGRLRNLQSAAEADYGASAADFYAAKLSLAGNTAKAWFNAVETEQQLRLTEETLVSFEQNLKIVEQTFDRGIEDAGNGDAALDVRLSRANVAAARARVAEAKRNRDASARSLEVLLGRYPSETISVSNNLPTLTRSVPTGLPSDLMLRRPDIIAQERRLAASGQRVSASRKAFLPAIRLTGSSGYQSESFRNVLSTESIATNIAAGLAQPVFEGGRLRAQLEESRANQEEALQMYAQTALEAFREVETTLAAEQYLDAQEAALKTAATESVEAEKLAEKQYERGLVDIITVLEAQRRSFDARSSRIALSNQRLQNRVDLYLALGGDFSSK